MTDEEKNHVQMVALQIFMKRMPTSPLTTENMTGYNSAIEQSVEIADLFCKRSVELLKETK